jgi:hypothetical protein
VSAKAMLVAPAASRVKMAAAMKNACQEERLCGPGGLTRDQSILSVL